MFSEKVLNKAYFFLLYLLVFVLGLRVLNEMDLWIFLKTGEWIYSHHKIPYIDPFSFLAVDAAWTHVKWGFSFLSYLTYRLTGTESSLLLLQAINNVVLLFFILKSTRLSSRIPVHFLTALLFILLFLGIEYRMVGRPEQFSHVFTIVYLYILLSYQKGSRKWIYILPFLQLIWCNMHDAFVVGWVLIAMLLVVEWGKVFLVKKEKPMTLSFIFVACLFVGLFSVLGVDVYLYPFHLASQLKVNQYTPELFSFINPMYWSNKEAYIMLFFFVLHLLVFIKKRKEVSFFHVLVVLGFLVLGLRTYRNIIFFNLVQLPFLLPYFTPFFTGRKKIITSVISIGVLVFCYSAIVTNFYYQNTGSKERFGLGVSKALVPQKAAEYIKAQELPYPLFSDYLSSAYFLWKLPPDVQGNRLAKTYLDLRDLDVFKPHHFSTYHIMMQNPGVFEQEMEKYHIQTIALYLGDFKNLHRHLYRSSDWHCIYVDFNTVVYSHTPRLMKVNTGDFGKEQASFSLRINKIFKPFSQVEKVPNAAYNVAKYFSIVGDYPRAFRFAKQAYIYNAEEQKNVLLWVKQLFIKASQQNDKKSILIEIQKVLHRFEKSQKNTFLTLKARALVEWQLSNREVAKNYALKALKLKDDKQLNALVQ